MVGLVMRSKKSNLIVPILQILGDWILAASLTCKETFGTPPIIFCYPINDQ
jgi:hypothetical protein